MPIKRRRSHCFCLFTTLVLACDTSSSVATFMPTMRAILNSITGRAVVLGLTLHAAACAHDPVVPTAPRIPIAVAPIGFGPDNGLTLEEQAECELGKELFEALHDEVGQSFALHGIADLRRVPGLLLVLRFARVEGHSMMSGIWAARSTSAASSTSVRSAAGLVQKVLEFRHEDRGRIRSTHVWGHDGGQEWRVIFPGLKRRSLGESAGGTFGPSFFWLALLERTTPGGQANCLGSFHSGSDCYRACDT